MRTRRLGRTGFDVTEIGFGAWGLGGDLWRGVDASDARRALYQAIEQHGMSFVDTALVYGNGHSERLVGEAIRDLRARDWVVVATKVPPLADRAGNRVWMPDAKTKLEQVFPPGYVVSCVEQSLRNLRAEVVPIEQLHVWNDAWLTSSVWQDLRGTMQRMVKEGKVLYWGVSVNTHDPESAIALLQDPLISTVQVIYNIYDRSPENELFRVAEQQDIGVIVRVPFDEGALTGTLTAETVFPADDWRNRYFRGQRLAEAVARAGKLEALVKDTQFADEVRSLPELALRFCLAHAAVDTVIPGMRRAEHVRQNAAVSDGRELSRELLERLGEHAWDKNWYL